MMDNQKVGYCDVWPSDGATFQFVVAYTRTRDNERKRGEIVRPSLILYLSISNLQNPSVEQRDDVVDASQRLQVDVDDG